MSTVQQTAVPAHVRQAATLGRIDYADTFVLDARGRTAEEWARATLEAAPAALRRNLRTSWTALGLRLGPEHSEAHVLGWAIARNTPDELLLSARSRLGMPAELLFQRRDGRLFFATLIQHRNPLLRVAWKAVVPSHVRTVRHLLRRAEG
jgi:hypothetical protein